MKGTSYFTEKYILGVFSTKHLCKLHVRQLALQTLWEHHFYDRDTLSSTLK